MSKIIHERLSSINNLQDLFRICCGKNNTLPLVKIRNKDKIEEISYKIAWEDACRIASDFIDRGYTGEYVPLIGAFSYEWLVFYMAVTISGNIVVPLENDSEEFISYIEDLNVSLMYIDRKFAKNEAIINSTELVYSNCDINGLINIRQYEKRIDDIKLPDIENEQLAMVIFTSGTTGKAKGVVLTHKNIIADTKCCLTYIDDIPRESSCTVSILPVTHMFEITVGILTAFYYAIPLCYGGGLKYFSKNMKMFKPDIMVMVPLIVENLYQKINQNTTTKKKIQRAMFFSNILRKIGLDYRRKIFRDVLEEFGGNLSVIICGGAYLNNDIIKWWDGIGVIVRCGYGITECSPVVSCNYRNNSRKNSVGKISPASNCRVKIIDDEICVTGDIVFKEYLNDPTATEEAFVDNYFKTGDLGYVDKEGFIYITGRKKNLIILSDGNNVSPEEIEAHFTGEEIIKEIIVTLKRFDDKEYITALINIDEQCANEVNDIDEEIQRIVEKVNYKLPAYKRIKKIEIVEEFKKTPLNKTKRYKYQK